MFAFTETRGPVEVAFTDRHGGVSGGPFASLNLAVNGSEDPAAVEENLDIVAYAMARGASASASTASNGGAFVLPAGVSAPRVALMRQVHGATVEVVGPATGDEPEAHPEADGLVTSERGVLLVVRVADCVPVLLADQKRGVIGGAHAGRPGLVAGVVPRAVAAMRSLGAEQVTAWVGPHVCGSCYEVPEQMRAEVTEVVPESFAETSWGTPALDIGAGVTAQLRALDVDVVDASRCTLEDDDLYSYRRQGQDSGRLAGLIWMRP